MMQFPLSISRVENLIGFLATVLLAMGLFLYATQEPLRIETAQEVQLNADLDNGKTLYAENCSVCHGLAGEGIGSTPALDNSALRQTDFDSLYKLIARGLYGTAMPAWSNQEGGPMSDYQINELVTLIQYGDWGEVQDRVVNLGLAPLVPFTSEPDAGVLESLGALDGGDLLVQGISLYAQECVACHGPDGLGTSMAPALNDTDVRSKPEEDLRRIILNGVSGTLMAPWNTRLGDEDVEALITLLTHWEQVPTGAIPVPERAIVVTEQSLALGSELYTNSCANCHGPEGQGTPRAPSLNVKGFLSGITDLAIQQIITLGVPGTSMPAWGDRMTDAEIQAIVGFIRAWEPTAPEVAEPARGGGPWWKSEGNNSSSGGGRGGPPWMRNGNAENNSGASLPRGGGVSPDSTQSDQPEEGVATVSVSSVRPQSGLGSEPQAGSLGSAHFSGEGGGPPWTQVNPSTSWWQEMDWRVFVFSSITISLALSLVLFAWVGLHRLSQQT